ncbi:hypothetical protein [Viridibacillus arvi]|uniref:hypothetical protein n=1 Tax=Viridibacillus arvi TaxID=263475 RepID=UPI0034CD166C
MMINHKLAKMHSSYGVYSEQQINGVLDANIISDLKHVSELRYLTTFYREYFNHYKKLMGESWKHQTFDGDSIARSTDLPFIGNKVIDQEKADYIFVFKGSLQKENKLSMTVLSCFWLFQNVDIYKPFFDRYWPNTQNYHPLVKNLGITRDIADKSYVTDFARIANENGNRDVKKCKQLLIEEINILNPKLIILVGSEPRNAFKTEISEQPETYMSVPFSLRGVPTKTQIEGPKLYEKLRNHLYIEDLSSKY